MSTNASQLSALSRLFSSGVFREIAKRGQSSLFARLLAQAKISCASDQSVGDAFDAAFALLRRSGMRDEYVYRAALTQNILLGTHSLNTACMLTEFRAGSCKADLAILNGTATVYEIKSERDSLTRLANQISNYRKVFAKVYVIVGDGHVNDVLENTPIDIGVMCLTRRHQITTIRNAADRPDRVCPVTIFESLRSSEACEILNGLGVATPQVPNTMLHSALRECFAALAPEVVHQAMVDTLKRTRSLAPLSDFVVNLPISLQPAALSIKIRPEDQNRLITALRTPISSAMDWT